MNRLRQVVLLAGCWATMAYACGMPSALAGPRANILFILADDQCFETLAAVGHEDIETPNLDRLARRGMNFTHAYNMGSWTGAVCVASRTMLNTGRFLWHARDLSEQLEQERVAGRFWSEYMKRAGYVAYMSGKWHVSVKAQAAFDHVRHVRGGMPDQTPAGYDRPVEGQSDPWKPWDPQYGGYWSGGKHWSEVVADDAVDYLHHAGRQDQPFFMYIAFNAPHDPRQSPREYVDRYPLDRIRIPGNFLPEYPHKDAIGCDANLRDEKLAPFPRTPFAVKVHRQEYFAIITHMDAQIGRILDTLDRSAMADNTYVFFTADHGLAIGHHGLLGKQNLYEHSVRVPFLVAGPGVPANQTNTTSIYLQDVMPTTLEIAGISKPGHVEFNSLMPLIRGEAVVPYPAIYGAYLQKQRMVCEDGFKLLLYPAISKIRLYNLREDPLEMRDLADDPQYRTVIDRLMERLVQLQQATGDRLDLSERFPGAVQ